METATQSAHKRIMYGYLSSGFRFTTLPGEVVHLNKKPEKKGASEKFSPDMKWQTLKSVGFEPGMPAPQKQKASREATHSLTRRSTGGNANRVAKKRNAKKHAKNMQKCNTV